MSETIQTFIHNKPLSFASKDGVVLDVHAIDSKGNFYGITTSERDPLVVVHCTDTAITHQTPISQINRDQIQRFNERGITGLLSSSSIPEDAALAIQRIRNAAGTRISTKPADIPNALPHKLCGRTL